MNSSRPNFMTWLNEKRGAVLWLFVGVLLPLAVFAKIAREIAEHDTLGFDNAAHSLVRTYANGHWDAWMLGLSMFGSPPLMVFFCGIIVISLWIRKKRGDALFFMIGTIGAGLLNQVAKFTFGRARPVDWIVIDPRSDYSFPSGHAMGTMALFTVIAVFLWNTKYRVTWLVCGGMLVFLIGISRVYIGVHYPTDVLSGWIASLSWVLGLQIIRNSYRGRVAQQSSTQ